MPITTGSIPKATQGGGKSAMKKNVKNLQNGLTSNEIVKMDKKADKLMSPAMLKKDIAADKKLLAQKEKKGGTK